MNETTYAITIRDYVRASTALSRRRNPIRFWLSVAFAALWCALGATVVAIGAEYGDDAAEIARSVAYVAFVVLIALPYTRAFLFALLVRALSPMLFQPMTIVGLSPTHLDTVSSLGGSRVAFSSFDERYDFGDCLVLAREGLVIPFIVPRRAFADEYDFVRIREAMLAAPSGVVASAVAAFAEKVDEDSLRYVLTPAEFRSGTRLLTARSWRRFIRPALVLLLGAIVGTAIATSSEPALTAAVVLGSLAIGGIVGMRRYRQTLSRLLLEVTLRYDASRVAIESKSSTLEAAWSDTKGSLEDELVFVIALPNDVGILVPKRVVAEETLAYFRERMAGAPEDRRATESRQR